MESPNATNTNTRTHTPKVEILLTHESQNTEKCYDIPRGTYTFPDGKQIIFGHEQFMIIDPSGKKEISRYCDKGILDSEHYICKLRFWETNIFFINNSSKLFVCDVEKMIEPGKMSIPRVFFNNAVKVEFKNNQMYIYGASTISIYDKNLTHCSTILPRCKYAYNMVQKGDVYYIRGGSYKNTKIYVMDSNGNRVSEPITEFKGTNGYESFDKFCEINYFFSLMNGSCDIIITETYKEREINIYVVDLLSRTVVYHLKPFTDRRCIERVVHDEINNTFNILYVSIDECPNQMMVVLHFKVNELLTVEEVQNDEKAQDVEDKQVQTQEQLIVPAQNPISSIYLTLKHYGL